MRRPLAKAGKRVQMGTKEVGIEFLLALRYSWILPAQTASPKYYLKNMYLLMSKGMK
jgi:hypothetical protein